MEELPQRWGRSSLLLPAAQLSISPQVGWFPSTYVEEEGVQ